MKSETKAEVLERAAREIDAFVKAAEERFAASLIARGYSDAEIAEAIESDQPRMAASKADNLERLSRFYDEPDAPSCALH